MTATGNPVLLKAVARPHSITGKYCIAPNMPVFVEKTNALDNAEGCAYAFTAHDPAFDGSDDVICIGVAVTRVAECTKEEARANKGRIMFTYAAMGSVIVAFPKLRNVKHFIGCKYAVQYGKPAQAEEWQADGMHSNHARASTFVQAPSAQLSTCACFMLMDVSDIETYGNDGGLFYFYGAGSVVPP